MFALVLCPLSNHPFSLRSALKAVLTVPHDDVVKLKVRGNELLASQEGDTGVDQVLHRRSGDSVRRFNLVCCRAQTEGSMGRLMYTCVYLDVGSTICAIPTRVGIHCSTYTFAPLLIPLPTQLDVCIARYVMQDSDEDAAVGGRLMRTRTSAQLHDNTDFVRNSAMQLTMPLIFLTTWFVILLAMQIQMTSLVWSTTSQVYLLSQQSLSTIKLQDLVQAPVQVGVLLVAALYIFSCRNE